MSQKMDWTTIYPVGSVFVSINSTNPSTYFVGTTWVEIVNFKIEVDHWSGNWGLNVWGNATPPSSGNSEVRVMTQSSTVGNNERWRLRATEVGKIRFWRRTA